MNQREWDETLIDMKCFFLRSIDYYEYDYADIPLGFCVEDMVERFRCTILEASAIVSFLMLEGRIVLYRNGDDDCFVAHGSMSDADMRRLSFRLVPGGKERRAQRQ